MLGLSGDDAHEGWARLTNLPGNTTRLDLAVTCPAPRRAVSYVEDAYRDFLVAPKEYNAPRRARLIQEDTGGATVYVGAPTSARIVRLYDHGHRHGYDEPGGSFRWEVQLRKNYAAAHWKLLTESENRQLAIAGLVRAATLDSNLPAPWVIESVRAIPEHRGASQVSQKLRWLESSVAPCVATLAHLGYLDEVLEALGLKDVL